MKAIIYAGIGLFSAASIYGAVDFYKTSKSGDLKALYKENTAPPINIEDRTINAEDYSRGKISEPLQANMDASVPVKTTVLSAKQENKKVALKKKIKKFQIANNKRKINLESFSRAKLVPKKIDTLTEVETDLYEQ